MSSLAEPIDLASRRGAPAPAAPEPAGAPVHVALKIAGFAIVFRAFSAVLALLSNIVFPDYRPEQFTVWGSTSLFWDAFARHDSGWYWQIARYGYTGGAGAYAPGGRSSIAYFPAYPLMMRYAGRALGRRPADLYIGGLVVSWAAFVLAMVGVYYLARLDLSPRRSERAAILTAIFPFAFVFGAVYSEALFLAATLACFYLFRTRRWILGGLCGGIATATRVNGIMMWPALAWIAWRGLGGGEGARREGWRAILGLLLVSAGIGSYSLYVYWLSGNPFEWAAAIQRWGYYPGGSPLTVFLGLGRALITHPYAFLAAEKMAPYDSLNGVTALACVVAVPFIWMRFGAGYGLYMAANLWLPLSSGQVEGMGRYSAVMFPLFIWLASLRSRTAFIPTVVVFAMLYTLCMALFTNLHPLF